MQIIYFYKIEKDKKIKVLFFLISYVRSSAFICG